MHAGIDARLFYYQPAGIGYYARRLVAALAELDSGARFTIFLSRRDRSSPVQAPGFHVRRLWTPPHHRFEQAGLAVELSASRLDVLHSPDFIPPFHRRFRSVVTVHDLAFLRFPHLLTEESSHYYGQIGRAVRSADAIIAVSESTRRDLMSLIGAPPDKISVVYEAADPIFRPLSADEARGGPGWESRLPREFILFVGTIEPRKNLPVLLRALARLQKPKSRPERLVLVGRPGWLHDEVYRLVEELRLGESVMFYGPASVEELLLLYNRARVLVVPSLYEGFGLPVVEAMSCGLPVLSSRGGALPEVAGDAGLLFSPEDVDGLAGLLRQVLDDADLRARMRGKGLVRAARFSWRRAAEETMAVYRRVGGS